MDYPVIAMTLQLTKKTNVELQSAPGKLYNNLLITVNGQILINLIISSTREAVSSEQCALMTRTAKASVVFWKNMCKCVSEIKKD